MSPFANSSFCNSAPLLCSCHCRMYGFCYPPSSYRWCSTYYAARTSTPLAVSSESRRLVSFYPHLEPSTILSIIYWFCWLWNEFAARSPILAHTNATINGLSTIRASNAQQALSDEYDSHQDVNTSAYFMFLGTSRGLALWLELVCVIYMAAVLAIFLVFADGKLFK